MSPRGRAKPGRPALGPVAALAVALALVAAAAWLMADMIGSFPLVGRVGTGAVRLVAFADLPVRNFRLKGDDFAYLAESRTRDALRAHLWTPHNAHVVPLFRLLTHALGWWTGDLAHVRATLAHTSFAVLALVMLAGGHFVAQETKSRTLGLGAMAGLGITTVMEPAASWYAASQALWAGLLILGMLLALQGWRTRGGAWRLGLALIATLAAPAAWSGGFAAGAVGWAYLWADGRSGARRASILPLAASGVAGAVAFIVARGGSGATGVHPAHLATGLVYTAQAIPEALILNNLGLDVVTTAGQGGVFCMALIAAWLWSRGGVRPSSLEAAGAALVVSCYAMAYTFRASFEFENLRALGWYHAIPQIGAVLFAAGWWSAARGEANEPSAWKALVVFFALVVLLLLLHVPRAQRLLQASVYPLTPTETKKFPVPELQRLRAIYLASDLAERQDRFLARLDRAERVAARRGIGRAAIRRTFSRVVVPGWPDQVKTLDAIDLLNLPENGSETDPARIADALGSLLVAEPEQRPDWIARDEPWPPVSK